MNRKYNYKIIIGFILGILLCGGSIYASIIYSANVFYYNNSTSTLTSNNVQAAIDELANKYTQLSNCPSNKICIAKKSTLALGDYISYTPSKTSYTTDTTYTGYTSTQTINPSELNLWRVIAINGDGTVDIISEDVSSVEVYFRGQTGYQNLVGYLNVLASQYETTGVTVGSRYFGYNGQTEFMPAVFPEELPEGLSGAVSRGAAPVLPEAPVLPGVPAEAAPRFSDALRAFSPGVLRLSLS